MTGTALLEWIGSLAGIAGAVLMAGNTRASAWAYPMWVVSSACLLAFSFLGEHQGLALQQAFFMVINAVGLWRWMIRPPQSQMCSSRERAINEPS